MKTIKIIALLLPLLALIACCDKTPKQVTGTISDASMNVVTIATADGQNITFSTMDADKSEANGMLLGSPVTVEYIGKLSDSDVTPATKVSTNPTYYKAVGSWVEPNPIDSTAVQGVELMVEGAAKSINMETLRYDSWKPTEEPDKIILHCISEGSGEPVEVSQNATIIEKDGKLTLDIDGVSLTKVN